ncbi:MAG TPA: IS1 family transposase [Blastocatellia bacterium]|nr:IS1 family transposase [Blastocatellia bacterium]
MCFEEITCPRCASLHIKKHGTTAQQKQRYRCKDCGRQFITAYTYRADQPQVRQLVVPMTMNGSGVRDISRVLRISTNTVLALIREAAQARTEPVAPKTLNDLEMDEFWSFVGKKKQPRWAWHAWDRQRHRVVAVVNGRRTDHSCQRLLQQLRGCAVRRFHTDQWEAYVKLLPQSRHMGKDGTRHSERRNLHFRSHIKRWQRRTICFSKSEAMHDAVIKLYVQHSNQPQHHI